MTRRFGKDTMPGTHGSGSDGALFLSILTAIIPILAGDPSGFDGGGAGDPALGLYAAYLAREHRSFHSLRLRNSLPVELCSTEQPRAAVPTYPLRFHPPCFSPAGFPDTAVSPFASSSR
jgi:hypothetical protein